MILADILYAARHARRLGLRHARRWHLEQYLALRAARSLPCLKSSRLIR